MTELEVFRESLVVSRIALIVTLVVSTLTVVFGVLEMAFQRSHNKKSVRPLCAFTLEELQGSLILRLRNVGLGPMIIESIRIEPLGLASAPPDPPAEAGQFADLVIPPLGSVDILALSRSERERLDTKDGQPGEDRRIVILYKDIYDRSHSHASSLTTLMHGAKLQLP